MAQKIGDAFVDISARTDKLEKNLSKTTGDIDKAFSKLGARIAGAFAVERIASFTSEAIRLASVADGVSKAFERLDSPGLLEDLKAATKGTVSELELMQKAVNAKNLGVPVENLANLFEFATQRASDTGESVDHLVNSIVVGIGRKSPLILDNLGISAIQLRDNLGGVSFEMASVGDIAAAVGKIATENLNDIGDTSLTTAQQIQQMSAQTENLMVNIGKALEPITKQVLSFTNEFLGALSAFAQFGAISKTELQGAKRFAKDYAEVQEKKINKALKEGLKTQQEVVKWLSEQIKKNRELQESDTLSAEAKARAKFLADEYGKTLRKLTADTDTATKAQKKLAESITEIGGKSADIPTPSTEPRGDLQLGGVQFGVTPEGLAMITQGIALLDKMIERQRVIAELTLMGSNIAADFGMALTSSFEGAILGGENFFASMFDWLKQLAVRLAAAAAAAFLLNTLLGGTGIISGGFSGLFGQFSGFGSGGALGSFDLFGKVRGDDILLSSGRAGTIQNRIGG